MGIPGIDSLLYQPASVVWSGEQPPTGRLAELIDILTDKIERDVLTYRDQPLVNEMAGMARILTLSQKMRLRYFQAYVLREKHTPQAYQDAYFVFGQAFDVAEKHAWAQTNEWEADLDSQIVLIHQLGLMQYGQSHHSAARMEFEAALELWQQRALHLADPPTEPEMLLRQMIGATQFLMGEFEAAAGSLARVLTLDAQVPVNAQPKPVHEIVGHALWTLGLVFRAQSDMQDGSESLLLLAEQRLKEGKQRFKMAEVHEVNLARIDIQLAETEFDLSDLYLQRQQDREATAMRARALSAVARARKMHRYADDVSGQLLGELALLRYEITQLLDARAALKRDDFDRKLTEIERKAADPEHRYAVVSAKAATLRGEWCLWMHDPSAARRAFALVFEGVYADNIGEATRAQRLLRRANDETRVQRVRQRRRIATARANRPLRRATGPRVSRRRATGPRVSRPRKRP